MLICDKQKNITVSRGDCFDIVFALKGLAIQEDDKICFSVKCDLKDAETCLCVEAEKDCEQNKFVVSMPTCDLKAGKYYYDIVYVSADRKRTLNFPARLTVVEVVHNE